MLVSRKALCLVYGTIAAFALVGTWAHAFGYLQHGYFHGFVLFWEDTLLIPAGRFQTVEGLTIGLTAMIWVVLEARRLGIRGVWVYLFGGMFIAFGFTLPLFMIHRERVLARSEASPGAGTLGTVDVIGLMAVGLVVAAYVIIALIR